MKRLAALLIFFAIPAHAQSNCGPRAKIIMQLQLRYEEQRVGAGVNGEGEDATLFEMWASEDLGTWTLLRTYPSGISCVLASGQGWSVKGAGGPTF